jgi:hypothetical protein
VKTRPSGEKRRKEMLRQERNREKAERRKARRGERQRQVESGVSVANGVEGALEVPSPLAPEAARDPEGVASSNARTEAGLPEPG